MYLVGCVYTSVRCIAACGSSVSKRYDQVAGTDPGNGGTLDGSSLVGAATTLFKAHMALHG